jgi:hypothetical protein
MYTIARIDVEKRDKFFNVNVDSQLDWGFSSEQPVRLSSEGDAPALVADVGLVRELIGRQRSWDLREIVSSAWDARKLGHK